MSSKIYKEEDSMKESYKKFKIGDQVSVRQPDEAYDGAPQITPNMIGIIKAFPPKVRKVKGPLYDNGDYFAYVEFDNTYERNGRTYTIRGGIDICNLRKA
jgi:hypothetical protein